MVPIIRVMLFSDIQDVAKIENENYDFPWCLDDFICVLKKQNVMGIVVEANNKILGYAIYEITKTRINILNILVDAKNRKKGIGKMLIHRIMSKILKRRRKIAIHVPDNNLDIQLFLKNCGFVATEIIKNYYRNSEDAYLMEYYASKEEMVI